MNFILCSDYEENWRTSILEVFNSGFLKEVNYDSEDRIDCIFGEITLGLQEATNSDPSGRDKICKIKEFFTNRGGGFFSVLQVKNFQNLLYTEEDIQSFLSELYSERDYHVEIRSVCLQDFGLNTTNFAYFLIIYRSEEPKFIINDNSYLSFERNEIDNDKDIIRDLPVDLLKYILKFMKKELE